VRPPCRIGIQLPEVERAVGWPEVAAIARAAEETGFDSVWVGDHHLYRDDGRPERGPWEAWSILAALAAVTDRVRLGPLVACLNFVEPGVLARVASTVDAIADGRLVLAVGAGWNRAEFDAFGIAFDHRAARFEEAFEIVRRLLAGERVTFAGRYQRVKDAVVLPAPMRRPPLVIGSNGPRMLAAALPHVQAWNTWFDDYDNRPDGFAELRARIDAACATAGRDPATLERSACLLVRVDERAAAERPTVGFDAVRLGDAAATIGAMAEAGADEVIVVADPITETSVRSVAAAIELG